MHQNMHFATQKFKIILHPPTFFGNKKGRHPSHISLIHAIKVVIGQGPQKFLFFRLCGYMLSSVRFNAKMTKSVCTAQKTLGEIRWQELSCFSDVR